MEPEVEYAVCHETGMATIKDITYAIQDGWMCKCGRMIASSEKDQEETEDVEVPNR